MKPIHLTIVQAQKLLDMLGGARIASSSFSANLATVLVDEGLMSVVTNGTRKSYRITHVNACRNFLIQHYTSGIELEQWIQIKSNKGETTRAEQVKSGAHSKVQKTRAFKGFLLTSCESIKVQLCGEQFNINPAAGVDYFIKDFERLVLPPDVIVVGVENGETFQHIEHYRYLFDAPKVIFVSRYPQSGDLLRWLAMIPNPYIHFGDFDLAGIDIYLNEFYATLGIRASFFIPTDIKARITQGSRELYDKQYLKFKDRELKDARLRNLIELIHKYKRAYEQEGYAEK